MVTVRRGMTSRPGSAVSFGAIPVLCQYIPGKHGPEHYLGYLTGGKGGSLSTHLNSQLILSPMEYTPMEYNIIIHLFLFVILILPNGIIKLCTF